VSSSTRDAERTIAEARLSIGALSSATGIPVETLRTWESRYGFPRPERKPSGHRVYPLSSVPRLRRIAEALARGHRAGQVVPASEKTLRELLELGGRPPAGPPVHEESGTLDLEMLVAHVGELAAEPLTRALLGDWARLGPLRFLETRVAPLAREVGEAWAAGRLSVRHEHFASERIEDVLRALRAPFDERARGPLAVLATLPEERHALGLQMAALVLATVGLRIVYLGPDCPAADMAETVRALKARVLAVSVSRSSAGAETGARLRRLRRRLPRRSLLLVGGEGAPAASSGIEVVSSLLELEKWAQRLVAQEH
jgi:methanogenic corrinoid protein MtbC1